jgi:hypothetical protein
MTTIPSSPASFSATVQSVTFAIPTGIYTAGIWDRNVSVAGTGPVNTTADMFLAGDHDAFPNTSETAGTYADSVAVTTAQIAAINAAAGGTLTASYRGVLLMAGQTINANSLTLTITPTSGGGGTSVTTQAVINPTNVVFARGYLFGTIQGGVTDDVPLAELQECSVKVSQELKEMMGPESRFPVAVGVSGKKCVITAKFGKFRARMVQMLLGGSAPTTSTGVTTVNIGVANDPVPFNLHLKSPSDGSDFEMKVFGLVCTDLQIPVKLEDFIYPDFNANAYGDGTNVIQILLPGDQTTS